ncbi:MAG: hypothetical protein ACYDDA_00415 [Acidiferrobacteraceae bacterium]
MNSAADTALLLSVLLQRSKDRRARVSDKTFKLLGRRERLRSAFVVEVSENLAADFGLCMIELDAGGFGIVRAKSLEAAKTITVKRLMTPEEQACITKGDLSQFKGEVGETEDGERDESD